MADLRGRSAHPPPRRRSRCASSSAPAATCARAVVKATMPTPSAFHFFRLGRSRRPDGLSRRRHATSTISSPSIAPSSRSWRRPAAATCSSTRCRSRCCATTTCADRQPPRAASPATLLDTYLGLIRAHPAPTARRHDARACTCAAATSAAAGWRRAATSRWRRSCSTRRRSMPSSWSTTASAPATSGRCASCRRASVPCSGSCPPRRPRSKDQACLAAAHRGCGARSARSTSSRSPTQCGFASVAGGNALSEDQQWAKLELIVETAERVWGRLMVRHQESSGLRGFVQNAAAVLAHAGRHGVAHWAELHCPYHRARAVTKE